MTKVRKLDTLPRVFIARPFEGGVDQLVSIIDERARRHGFVTEQGPHLSPDRLLPEVSAMVHDCVLLIAVMITERPNVFFEIGIAHGLGKSVILIADRNTPLHMLAAHTNVIVYDRSPDQIVLELDAMLRQVAAKQQP